MRNISVMIAIGVATDGFRQILGVAEDEEDLRGWRGFLRDLERPRPEGNPSHRHRRLQRSRGGSRRDVPNTDSQRRVVLFYRNVFTHAPNEKVAEVAHMLKAIHAQESRRAAQAKATEVVARLKEMKLRAAAELVEQKVSETMTYYVYPSAHWRQLRTNNPFKRIIREIRRRTRVVGAFPPRRTLRVDVVAARLRHIAATKWGKRRYLVMDALLNPAKQEVAA